MMRLTKVELRRLFSRRLTAIALLGALVITGLTLFGTYMEAKPLTGAEMASQRAQFALAQRDWKANGDQQVQECLKMQPGAPNLDPATKASCQQMEPKWENYGKPRVKFVEMMVPTLQGGSYLMAFVGFLVGAGFVAAEFSSGSMGNWLTFEPRRMRVFASKLGSAGLGLVPATVAVLGLLTAGVWLIVGHYASTAGTTGKVWGDLAEMAGRSIVLALAAAVVGAAFGMLFRHTAAVIGIAMGYLVLVEGVFGQALQGARPWLLQVNFNGWLEHGTHYLVDKCTTDALGSYSCQSVQKVLSFGHSAAYLGLLVVLAVAFSALVFRRRDVS
jgi:ABC-2 type transport system permease protein